jgi:hypothetical protein
MPKVAKLPMALRAFLKLGVSNESENPDWLDATDDLSNAMLVYRDSGLRVVLESNRSHLQQKFADSDRSQRLLSA